MSTHLKLTIEKTVYGGFGLGFSEGLTCFVPYSLPGEVLLVTPYKKSKKTVFAAIDSIEIPSPERTAPPCPNFGLCGGCDFQHTSYENELHEKKGHIEESLRRIAKKDEYPEIKTIGKQRYHYRTVAGIKYSAVYGFYRKGTHEVIAFPSEGCRLLDKRLTAFLQHGKLPKKDFRLSAGYDGNCVTDPSAELIEMLDDLTFSRKNESFFQANGLLRTEMIAEAIRILQPDSSDICIDAGCGSGFFSLPLARKCRQVYAFDTDSRAILSAKKNAQKNGIGNINFVRGSFDDIRTDKAGLLLADPPRGGLSKKFVDAIENSSIKKILYVSCDPSSWARDLLALSRFKLSAVTHIDMFPATHHIELISLIERI